VVDADGNAAGRPDETAVDRIVLAFIARIEEGRTVDLDRFCEEQPEALRPQVRERCKGYLEIQRVLGQLREPPRGDSTGTNVPPPDPMLGRQFGSYVIEKRLGEGGMGVVYLARQPRLDRPVAVKVLPPAFAAKQSRRERFEREARLPAKLDHPGIVKVFDAREEGDLRWYAMEYVAGRSLQDILHELRRLPTTDRDELAAVSKGWITRAAQLAAEVADALEHAHQRGVVHRDVKPSNVLIDANGAARVVDFGLALDLGRDDGITNDGEAIGTLSYMSPEQARGDRERMGPLTDVYSLGIVLYEMLTLRVPFDGVSRQRVLSDIASAPPRPVRRFNPRVPIDLETICLVALEKNPQHRYSSAAALARDLRHFLNHEAIEAKRPPIWRRIGFELRRRRALVAGFLAGAVLLSVASAVTYDWRERARRPHLTVVGSPQDRGATVFVRAIDVVHGTLGEPRQLGTLPLERAAVEPGVWRIVVEKSGAFAEHTRVVQTDLTLHATLVPTEVVAKEMILVAAGTFRFGLPNNVDAFLHDEARDEPDFLIDRCEVSNADWRTYLKEREQAGLTAKEPLFWRYGREPGYDALPVTGVTWEEAAEYAEWHGKRLPTMHEWEKAARGTSGALYPWGDDLELLAELFPPPPPEPLGTPEQLLTLQWKYENERFHPVDQCDARAASHYGLYHVFGNVREWTESINLVSVEGVVTPSFEDRFVKGASWKDASDWHRSYGLTLVFPLKAAVVYHNLGFRCAKSIRP
jgi:serine/threonine protein kinase/formylglycine-generating enzyme required for sulfatase activity